MSADNADDLHAAEDFAAGAAAALAHLTERLGQYREAASAPFALAEAIVREWDDYCRPTCGADGDPASDECVDDTCGCPCGHVEMAQEIRRMTV